MKTEIKGLMGKRARELEGSKKTDTGASPKKGGSL
jgi:hypothetical protein